MQRVSSGQAERIRELSNKLGDRTLRQLLTPEGARLTRPERLRNLESGRGKLSTADVERLDQVSRNANQLVALKKRAKGKQEFKTNRSLRTWLFQGKTKDEPPQSDIDQRNRVIRALWFLGVDPSDGTFYVRRQR